MIMYKKHSFFYKNGLSIVMLTLMLLLLICQFIAGMKEKNNTREENSLPPLSAIEYLHSPHFIQATFENWESEFLQMGIYVLLTVSLRQKGSSESKSLDGKEAVDREPKSHIHAPWPVKKGGLWLKIYSHSLSLAFFILFLLSFVIHFYGSFQNHNEEQAEKHMPQANVSQYLAEPTFWFESFQNWQSEFLAVFSIVVLSIWLRQKGSPESKPVDASYDADAE